jgi:hypothetical protein
MAKKTVPFQLTPEMDVAHAIVPRKATRKILDVHGGEIMRQKTIEISQLLWHDQDSTQKDVDIRVARALELFESLEPADGAEGMIATQMVGTHFAALECLRRATLPNQTFEGRDMALKHAEKLMALYAKQLATLDKHRGKGQQKVTVEHVHVEAGGQAIVGNVETGQRGKPLRSVSGTEPDAIEHMPDPQIPEVQTKSAVARKKP